MDLKDAQFLIDILRDCAGEQGRKLSDLEEESHAEHKPAIRTRRLIVHDIREILHRASCMLRSQGLAKDKLPSESLKRLEWMVSYCRTQRDLAQTPQAKEVFTNILAGCILIRDNE